MGRIKERLVMATDRIISVLLCREYRVGQGIAVSLLEENFNVEARPGSCPTQTALNLIENRYTCKQTGKLRANLQENGRTT